ncbi:MAG: ABC transporter ATP-binding protein [Pirellulaceae bacterium]
MTRFKSPDSILEVDGVWKKYCRNLKRAMWYGLQDVGRQMLPTYRTPDKPQDLLRAGEFFAARDVSFSMRPGECVGLIGPNGAGKSTVLKMVNGLLRPDLGEIRIRGRIGALIELGTGFNPQLSGRENVFINGTVLGLKKREIERAFDDIVSFAELEEVIDDPIKTYSSGMRMRLGFSVAANLRPQLLIMDEVLAVGDVGFRMKCFKHLNTLIEQGTSIVLVTHAVSMLPRVATRLIVFDKGQVRFDGDVNAGLATYDQMLAAHQQEVNERKATEISSGAAIIHSVSVEGNTSDQIAELRTGDSLTLNVELEAQETVRDARLVVAVGCANQEMLASVSTRYQGIHFDLQPGIHRVQLKIDAVPFLLGAYHFNVSLFGDDITDFHHRRTGVAGFRVVGPETNSLGFGIGGLVQLNHHWHLESISESNQQS